MRFLAVLFLVGTTSVLAAQEITIRETFGEPVIHQVEFSPYGEYLYGTDGYSNIFRIELSTGELELFPKEHESTIRAIDISGGGELVSVDMNQQLRRWSGFDALLYGELDLSTDVVIGFPHMAVNPETDEVLLANGQVIMLTPLRGGEAPRVFPSELGFISAATASPEGTYWALSFGDRETEIVPTESLEDVIRIKHYHTHGYALAFTLDEKRLYFTDGRQLGVQVIGEDRATYVSHRFASTLSALRTSPTGHLAIGTVNGEVSLLNPQADTLVMQLRVGADKINDLSFSRDGLLLAAATDSGIYWINVAEKRWLAFTTTVDKSNGYVHFSPNDHYQANAQAEDYLFYYDEEAASYSELPANDPMRQDNLLPRLLAGERFERQDDPCHERLSMARQSFAAKDFFRASQYLDDMEVCDVANEYIDERQQLRRQILAAVQQQSPTSSDASTANVAQVDVLNRDGKDLALFFAIDTYEEWPDLDNPVSDAEVLAGDLSDRYGFMTEIVRNPSKREIYDKLEEYRQRTYAQDAQLFIFFSGHGEFNESTEEGFLIPAEGLTDDPYQESYIPHSRLAPRVDNIPCAHILLAIDACYSGTFDQQLEKYRGLPGQAPGGAEISARSTFVTRLLRDQSRLYVTSGGKERTPDGDEHSPFTEHWLQALRSYGGTDSILTYRELMSVLEGAEPQPRSGPFGSHEIGGSFLFLAK